MDHEDMAEAMVEAAVYSEAFVESDPDPLYAVCERIGAEVVAERRRIIDSDPDGEGFVFMAAENQMSTWDLMTSMRWAATDRAVAEILTWTPERQALLVALAAW